MRYFRDKLAMRMRALDRDVRVPDFVPVVNHGDIRYYLDHVPGPVGVQAAPGGVRHRHQEIPCRGGIVAAARTTWRQAVNLSVEKFVPGDVFHVDSVVSENEVVFSNVSQYGKPPMNVAHGGGVFTTFTVPRGGEIDHSPSRHQPRPDCRAWTAARRRARRIHPRPCRRRVLFSGVCGARGRSLHQRNGRGRDWNQSMAGMGPHRSRRRRWEPTICRRCAKNMPE